MGTMTVPQADAIRRKSGWRQGEYLTQADQDFLQDGASKRMFSKEEASILIDGLFNAEAYCFPTEKERRIAALRDVARVLTTYGHELQGLKKVTTNL